jgi:hypothetical protein
MMRERIHCRDARVTCKARRKIREHGSRDARRSAPVGSM